MHDMTKFRVANVSIGTIMLILIVNELMSLNKMTL